MILPIVFGDRRIRYTDILYHQDDWQEDFWGDKSCLSPSSIGAVETVLSMDASIPMSLLPFIVSGQDFPPPRRVFTRNQIRSYVSAIAVLRWAIRQYPHYTLPLLSIDSSSTTLFSWLKESLLILMKKQLQRQWMLILGVNDSVQEQHSV